MSKAQKPRMWPVDEDKFDAEKFMLRYQLTKDDFSFGPIGSQCYVALKAGVELKDDPPVFEAPPPLKTREEYGYDLLKMLKPGATQDELTQFVETYRKFTGDLPPDRKTE